MYKLAIFPLLVAAASAGYLTAPVVYAPPVHGVPAATSYANTYRVSSTVRATPLVQQAAPVLATAPILPQYSTGYTTAGSYGGYRAGSYGYGSSSYGTSSGSSRSHESGNSGSYGSESSYGGEISGNSYGSAYGRATNSY